MTAKIGALSSSVIAAIAVGGVFGLVAIIIIVALVLDIPKRMKRRQHAGIIEPSGRKSLELEKGSVEVSSKEVSSTSNTSTNYSSMRPTRPASPECTCAHPVISHKPPRVYSP